MEKKDNSDKIYFAEEGIVKRLKEFADPKSVEGMARFGIDPDRALGVKVPEMRRLAREIRKGVSADDRHRLAKKLWDRKIRETMILAGMIAVPKNLTEELMEEWVGDFYDWETCDQSCANLFEKTPFAYDKAVEWSRREEEFVKRAGYVMMARLAVSDKKADDEAFTRFFSDIKRGALDERNMVKKAVNWAIRQIGKRNPSLNERAVQLSLEIKEIDSPTARWIAADALRELTSDAVLDRLKKKEKVK
ncbi:MAG: DNA alkylation repair protein [Deltaproteobacteria bacterium]|uniref:DNA alkylation repair protein n=1 Tax=Candidatus Zymogenus saltonus TaxID=2844893 RepID=A0A9D8KF17_9DELT|nr:DNA alkylation repair protein [Candidatus Zymogenus saltonus]